MHFFSRQKIVLILPVAVAAVFTFSACAVRTPVRPVVPAELPAHLKYETILLKDMTLSPDLKANVATTTPIMQCENSVISYLRTKNIFKTVEKFSEKNQGKKTYGEHTLIVETELTYLRIVSSAARIWGGMFAGRSAMKINAVLRDGSDGRILAKEELVGAPSAFASEWGGGAVDSALPDKMGYLLGDYIVANVAAESK